MNAFVLIHFGDKLKYLELEIYTVIMLRKNTKNDIIYLYSINDTPREFIKIMKKMCNKVIGYDDLGITYNIKEYKSQYTHFNTLRTCNFIYAYKLLEYSKICIIESDLIILKNIDDIFELKTPSILTYYNIANMLDNCKIKIDKQKCIQECNIRSNINGGVLLITPSLTKYNLYLNNIKVVIENKCIFPNETLFLISNEIIYNLPYKYNGVQYQLLEYANHFKINMKDYLSIVHLNNKENKHVDIIRDKYLDKIKKKNFLLYYFINIFKNIYYDKYNEKIKKIFLHFT